MKPFLAAVVLMIAFMVGQATGNALCSTRSNCSECIQEATCIWCTNSNRTVDKRCKSSEDSDALEWRKHCGSKNVIEPQYYFERLEDEDFSENEEQIIQLKPQKVYMALRVKEPFNMTLQYKHFKNYPTDLYYLMDGSKSMNDDQKTLANLGQDLADSMKNITSDFRLGFGIFVEKAVLPFVTTVPLSDPSQSRCGVEPYSFHNALPLTHNASLFEDKVTTSKTACNIDVPECGLDALMQVIVCKKEIDWRNQSLKLIVLATDAGFHLAGDGKLGGIINPNDMTCHLNSTGYYTHHNLVDYPSVSQINHMTKQSRATLVFAITKNLAPLYDRLSQIIEGASYGVLKEDSSNIVGLLTEKVDAIVNKAGLRDTAKDPLTIKYFSTCKDGDMKSRSTCDQLSPGDLVEFKIEITVEKCTSNLNQHQVFTIYPDGKSEAVEVNLTMICQCKCEEPGDKGYKESDELCKSHGDNKCGVCSCHEGYLGQFCECEANNATDVSSNDGCKRTNDSSVCSGKGTCICGQCDCNKRNPPERIYGTYCECTNYENCKDSANGLNCSGNGECMCSNCSCNEGWKGPHCNCQDSEESCKNPGSGEMCSGKGTCECNQCKCESPYFGKHCEDCNACGGKCVEYKPCVQCQAFKTGEITIEECENNCTLFNVTIVPTAEVEKDGEYFCSFFDENGCRFSFVYTGSDGVLKLRVQKELECSTPVNILGVVLGILGIIVLIGLAALIVWKVLAVVQDRREYAKFILDQNNAKWADKTNPIYKMPTTTTQNPIFGKMD